MPEIVQWLVDTHKLWTAAKSTVDLELVAYNELSLLSAVEKRKALSFKFVKDAKLSLASSLLKRLVISRYAQVSWNDAISFPDDRKKPVFRSHSTGKEPVAFNVSHQDGLVVLAAVCGYESSDGGGIVEVGVDVVSTIERRPRDLAGLAAPGGWNAHVNIYAEIFAAGEVTYLKNLSIPAHIKTREEEADYRLRYFYALWCLREAYVKMDGQALTAPWISDLEFCNFHPPKPESGVEECTEIRLYGIPVEDARVELRSWGLHYIIGTAIRTPAAPDDAIEFRLGAYHVIDLDMEMKNVVVQIPEDVQPDGVVATRIRQV